MRALDAGPRRWRQEARRQAPRNGASILDSARELGIRDAQGRQRPTTYSLLRCRMLKRDRVRSYALIGAQARLAELDRERVDILETFPELDQRPTSASATTPVRKRRKMSDAAKKAASIRMKKYWLGAGRHSKASRHGQIAALWALLYESSLARTMPTAARPTRASRRQRARAGRPSRKPLVRYKSFPYQAESWTTPRRVVAKVEHHVIVARALSQASAGPKNDRQVSPSCARQRRPDVRRHATLPQSWIQRENWEFETHRLLANQ